MGKCIGTDNGLVWLHGKTGDAETRREQVMICVVSSPVLQGKTSWRVLHRHHHLFQRGITGPLTESIDGAFDLACAIQHGGKGIATASPRSL